MSDPAPPANVRALLCAAALGALVVALYAPALGNGFVNWDDDRVVLANPAVVQRDGLATIWSTVELPADFPNYPLLMSLYWLEYRLAGPDPRLFHAVNVGLHGLNTGLVFLLLLGLGAGWFAAAVAALLFGVHPLQVEAVAWVAECKTLLATSFALLTLLAYRRHRVGGAWSWYAATVLLFLGALLSKTATVVLPLSLLLVDRLLVGRWTRTAVVRVLPLLVLALLAGLLTIAVERQPLALPWSVRPLLAASVLWFYVGKLLLPVGLSPIYPRWQVDPWALQWWTPVLGLFAAALLLWRWRPDWRVRWGLGHFVVMLLPVLGLVSFGFHEFSFVADRQVYLPSVGFCLVLGLAAAAARQRLGALPATAVAAIAIVALGGLTLRQLPVWRDSVTLWQTVLAANPDAWVAHNNLAFALIERQQLAPAAAHLERAIAIYPEYAEAYNNLALVAYRRGDLAAAEQSCRRAVALRPDVPDYAKNLGVVLQARQTAAGG